MKKILTTLLFSVICIASFAQIPGNDFGYDEYNSRRRDLFKKLPPITRQDIVFLGNSITDGCEWNELFGNSHIKNRGISGDHAEWMIDRLEGICKGQPKKLFLMIGINDLGAHVSADSTAMFVIRVLDSLQSGTPRTKIYLQSILPNNDSIRRKSAFLMPEIIEVNKQIKKAAEERGITYIDLYSVMVIPGTMELNPLYTYDGLHMNGTGYDVWRDAMMKYVK
ncbi:MAG: GDSL-type esterase/lipase family protein [Bacteroidales bacterium]|jgi:lysophospholipase L1-like esterase|nr:GDSL-type esterase/lipase family protein [Bacteroidales bacterium]MCI2145587.1 GDSL-type esterase/lipase family protein [Bacteroidales bacterium]